jgi:hypothetical protein
MTSIGDSEFMNIQSFPRQPLSVNRYLFQAEIARTGKMRG